jgi:hypothetical protein
MQAWFDAGTCKEGHVRIGGGHVDFQIPNFKMSTSSGTDKTSG